MTTKQIAQIGFIILFTLIAQHLMATEETNSQNLTPFQQMQHLIKSNFDNDPNAPKYSKTIQIFNLSFPQNGNTVFVEGTYRFKLNILINKAVVNGMRQAIYLNKRLKIYSSGIALEDDLYDIKGERYIDVPYCTEWGQTKKQCIERIAEEEMNKNSIDVLVSGYYLHDFNPPKICLVPFVIDKRVKGIRSETLCFYNEELTKKDPFTGTLLLRPDVEKNIARSVCELLSYLPESQ